MKVPSDVILRTAVLAVTWVNMILTGYGLNPLPFSDDQVYEGVTALLAFGASIWAWWKNNSFSTPAIEADKYKDKYKEALKNG